MTRGDLVHVPQGALLLKNKHNTIQGVVPELKPMIALFWDQDPKEPRLGSIYYKKSVWDVKMSQLSNYRGDGKC